MVMMTGGAMIVRLAFVIRRIFMMTDMIIIAVVHHIDGKIVEAAVFVRYHQSGRVLHLSGRLCGQRRRVDHHQRDAERADEAIKSGGGARMHVSACSCASPA